MPLPLEQINPNANGRLARFGLFQLDFSVPELRRKGQPVSLQQQQMVILAELVKRAGSIVTREDLQSMVWSNGTYVEFEFGLNTAINRLRRALGDTAREPLFIETVPKQGYRFIAPVEFTPAGVIETAAAEIAPLAPPVVSPAPPASRPATSLRLFGFVLAGYLFLFALLAFLLFDRYQAAKARQQRQIYRFTIALPPGQVLHSLAISPKGDQIVYEAWKQRSTKLYRRYFDEEQFRTIPGTEDGHTPFFSPDSQNLGFITSGKVKILDGSAMRTIATFPPSSDEGNANAIWGEDGFIYFNAKEGNSEGIWRVSAKGGPPELVIKDAQQDRGMEFAFPNQIVNPTDAALLYSIVFGPMRRSLHLMDLRTRKSQTLMTHGVGGEVLPTGHLLFYRDGSLFAVPFRLRDRRFSGSPIEVLKGVANHGWFRGETAVSKSGTLAYLPQLELPQAQIEWLDHNGRATPLPIPPGPYEAARISPDGRKLAVVRRQERNRWAVLTYDLQSGAWNSVSESDIAPPRAVWSPDGLSLAVSSAQQNGDFANLMQVPVASPQSAQRLTEQANFGQIPQAWSAKANAILFMEGVHPLSQADVVVLPLSGDRRPRTLVATPAWDRAPSFSPDGRWLTYESNFSGTPQVYVQAYDAQEFKTVGPLIQVSQGGGRDPIWSTDGRSLIYTNSDAELWEAELSLPGAKTVSRKLAAGPFYSHDGWTRAYDMAPDGRLLLVRPLNSAATVAQEIEVVVNWFDELKQLAPVP